MDPDDEDAAASTRTCSAAPLGPDDEDADAMSAVPCFGFKNDLTKMARHLAVGVALAIALAIAVAVAVVVVVVDIFLRRSSKSQR